MHYHSEVISGYTVNISQSSPTQSITVNRTMATILNLPAVSRFTVNVLARNSAGNSPPLTIQINPKTTEQRAPACVTTVHVEGFTYEVIFSTSEEGAHVDMVIYYWCQGVKHDEFVDCKGFLEWKEVPIANVTRSDGAFRYNITTDYADNTQFAVVLQDDGGTSDMVWGTTAYHSRKGGEAPGSSSVAETVLAVTLSVLVLLIVISIAIFKLCDRGSPSIQIELPVISSRGESADSALYNIEDISNVRRKNDTYADLA
uniref:Uncharacterized protein LOC111121388 isoform X1 n=1 Tax=Crassostrea virginica TaxID=6565 RepID=A0A8B8CRB3_CRAVI|nr:uncharacterized protein LOC111121388 isoform X1 [Crassostrea virginica]